MLRPITPADTDGLVELTAGTGFFRPLELDTLREVLDDYHAGDAELGHHAIVWQDPFGQLNGYAYYAPAAMTDRTWYLYWIAVRRDCQGLGIGGQILEAVERHIRDQNGRLLLIETSGTAHYAPTRRFYLKYGYTLAAEIPDYYADGDGLVVFGKRLTPLSTPL